MELNIYKDLTVLSYAAADKTVNILNLYKHNSDNLSIAVSGGSTPLSFYKILTEEPYVSEIPWDSLNIYWCDERCVDFSHPESNFGQFSNILLNKVKIPHTNIHPIECKNSVDLALTSYEKELSIISQKRCNIPIFDIVFLGLGEDGHTASLFPGEITNDEQNYFVISTKSYYQNRPAERISLTPKIINQAKNIIFLVSGKNKASILNEIINGPDDPNKYPAQRINPVNGKMFWLIDESSAIKLKKLE